MRQRMRGRLVGAIFAAGLVGAMALGNPSALAVNPRFRRRLRRRSIRPLAAGAAASAGPVRAATAARGPVRLTAAAPAGGSVRATAAEPVLPAARRSARGAAAADSGGHACRPEPDAVRRAAGVRAADVQPDERLHRRRRQADLHQLPRPIADRAMAEQAIHISSVPPVPGRFYWTSDTQVRWRPQDFWPAGTVVNIDAGGAKSSFTVPEQLVADHRRQDAPDGRSA